MSFGFELFFIFFLLEMSERDQVLLFMVMVIGKVLLLSMYCA
jgi:hypothetical protein